MRLLLSLPQYIAISVSISLHRFLTPRSTHHLYHPLTIRLPLIARWMSAFSNNHRKLKSPRFHRNIPIVQFIALQQFFTNRNVIQSWANNVAFSVYFLASLGDFRVEEKRFVFEMKCIDTQHSNCYWAKSTTSAQQWNFQKSISICIIHTKWWIGYSSPHMIPRINLNPFTICFKCARETESKAVRTRNRHTREEIARGTERERVKINKSFMYALRNICL